MEFLMSLVILILKFVHNAIRKDLLKFMVLKRLPGSCGQMSKWIFTISVHIIAPHPWIIQLLGGVVHSWWFARSWLKFLTLGILTWGVSSDHLMRMVIVISGVAGKLSIRRHLNVILGPSFLIRLGGCIRWAMEHQRELVHFAVIWRYIFLLVSLLLVRIKDRTGTITYSLIISDRSNRFLWWAQLPSQIKLPLSWGRGLLLFFCRYCISGVSTRRVFNWAWWISDRWSFALSLFCQKFIFFIFDLPRINSYFLNAWSDEYYLLLIDYSFNHVFGPHLISILLKYLFEVNNRWLSCICFYLVWVDCGLY